MLKSTYIDPSFSSATRLEFKIPSAGEVIVSKSLEVTNFGVASVVGNPALLKNGGIYNFVKHAYLYSGNIELEAIRDANVIVSDTMLLGDSDYEESVSAAQTMKTVTASFLAIAGANTLQLNPPPVLQAHGNLKLADIFPLLKSLPFLINFKDLRVVLELHTVIADLFKAPVPNAYTLLSPVLKFESDDDEVSKSKLIADPMSYGNVAWQTIYNEIRTIPNTVTSASYKLRGFTEKVVNDIIVQVIPTANPSDATLGFGYSQRIAGEVQQLTVNNKKLLPLNGLDTDAKKLMSMEAYKLMGYYGTAMPRGTGFATFGNAANALFDRMSFGRFEIKDRVNDLQFDYAVGAGAAYTLRFIGSCQKYLSRDKEGNVLLVGF